jgi:hypothetical protein
MEIQIVIEIGIFLAGLVGVYVGLSNKITRIETENSHLMAAIAVEKADRKETEAAILEAAKSDRKVFEAHQKETTAALNDLTKVLHGLQVFLEHNGLRAKPGRKPRSL